MCTRPEPKHDLCSVIAEYDITGPLWRLWLPCKSTGLIGCRVSVPELDRPHQGDEEADQKYVHHDTIYERKTTLSL